MQIVHVHALASPFHFTPLQSCRPCLANDAIKSIVHSFCCFHSFPDATHLVVAAVLLRPVAHQLEPADDLADGEESDDFSSDNANGRPLCVGHAADLGEEVLGCGVAGLGCDAVHERSGLAEGVHGWLHVCLHCLDGAVWG
jgi:hypothetical protein